MKKILLMCYSINAYIIGLSSLIYMTGFLVNLYVPKGIDGESTVEPILAWLLNIMLAVSYFIVHSIMGRPRFKRWWTSITPSSIERSTYVLVSGVTFYLLVILWQPVDIIIWSVQHEYGRGLILSIYLFAWLTMIFATFNIDHFSFFGIRQVWHKVLQKSDKPQEFSAKYLYRFTRHPISLCWFIVLWTTPVMSLGHIIFSTIGTIYIVLVTPIEEKDLVNEIGAPYKQYQKKVRRFLPIPK